MPTRPESLIRAANGGRTMCLAVPMRIVSVQGHLACCEARGVQREVSLTLLGDAPAGVGDYVLIHVGYAIQIITAADADTTWMLFDEIAAQLDLTGA